jgi:hypothetical protein
MRDRSILLFFSALTVCAFGCGDDRPPPMAEVYGGSGGGTSQPGFCSTYCASIVAKPTCENYNAGSHCEQVCGWYLTRPACVNEYTAFANCAKGSSRTACYYLSTSGNWGLNGPPECATARAAFDKCVNDNNVGFCPYGS